MVKGGHDGRPEVAKNVDYQPARPGAPFEAFSLASLRRRVPRINLAQLERLRFELVIAGSSGSGCHEVDFERVEIDRHHWIHIRPGQVHRWIDPDYDATLLVLAPRARSPHWRPGPRVIGRTDEQLHDAEPLLRLLRHERRADPGGATLQLLRDLAVRWLELDLPDDGDGDPLYVEFRRLLGREAVRVRSVDHYARRLNCSTRTLARACERSGAPAPKRLIDEAVLLEAKRLLALPDASITATATTLGFTEPTNFTKFFKRLDGTAPSDWLIARAAEVAESVADLG